MGLKDRMPTTPEEYREYRSRLSNWSRWGEDDRLGTLNHITEETRRAAAGLVRLGRTVSCSNALATRAVVADERRNRNAADHRVTVNPGSCVDYVGVSYHGYVNTHIDALCHVFTGEGGRLYNDADPASITETGAGVHSVDAWRHGIVTRGVLYDIPKLRGHDHVRQGEPVEGWDLEDWAREAGIEPRAGDAVFIRSGSEPFWTANPDFVFEAPPNTPGVAVSVLEFLHDTNAALLGWDLQEAGGQPDYGARIPIHSIAIPYMGLPLLDNANFEELSAVCAETGRYEFMLTVAPLVVLGGTGSPVNPIATF